MPELQVRDLKVWYGAAQALFDVSLTVGAGELVVLQGLNGAGKSTLLQSILGLSQRQTGVIRYQNQDVSDWAPHRRAHAGLGFVAEDRRLFGALTVQENLLIAARGDVAGNTARVLALFPALERMLQRRASQVGRCGRHVREHVQQVMVDLQFQDRVDQLLDQVRSAMDRSLAQLQRDLPHGRVPARGAWQASLSEGYTTDEQRRSAAELSDATSSGPAPGETVFF